MIRCAQDPEYLEVWGTGQCTRGILYIDDAVEGVLAMVDAPAGSAINIGSGQEVSSEFGSSNCTAFGIDIEIVLDPSSFSLTDNPKSLGRVQKQVICWITVQNIASNWTTKPYSGM